MPCISQFFLFSPGVEALLSAPSLLFLCSRTKWLGMSMERSRNGSCFFEDALHTWQVTYNISLLLIVKLCLKMSCTTARDSRNRKISITKRHVKQNHEWGEETDNLATTYKYLRESLSLTSDCSIPPKMDVTREWEECCEESCMRLRE